MEPFDNRLKAMAEEEECIVPNGFDGRLRDVLESLPSQVKKKGLGAVKTALIAAAVCAAMICTAFAASPELRGMLAEVLGGFASYAQEQEDKTYTMDGFEVKVLSALSDGVTLRAYVQVRDLEGHRLSADMEPWGVVNVLTDDEQGLDIDGTYWSYSFDRGYAVYDAESETALLVFTSWAQSFGDLKDAKLEIRHIYDYMNVKYEPIPEDELSKEGITVGGTEGEVGVTVLRPLTDFKLNDVQLTIPLTVESMPKLTFGPDSELGAYLGAELVELSPLGLTVTSEGYGPEELFFNPVRVRMADGTEIDWENSGAWNPSGQGSYSNPEEGLYGTIMIWNFAEAIDLDQVDSVYVCGKYFPVK